MENTTLRLPIRLITGALHCASTDEARHYINTVFLKRENGSTVQIAATDGKVLYVANYELGENEKMPDWLTEDGLNISFDHLALAAKHFDAVNGDGFMFIDYDGAGSNCKISDPFGLVTVRQRINDGAFPAYSKVIEGLNFENNGVDMEGVGIANDVMTMVMKVAKTTLSPDSPISKSNASFVLYRAETPESPMVATVSEPGVMMVLFPLKRVAIPAATSPLMGVASKGTLSAIKAHRTMAKNRGDDAKVAEYDRRIADLSARINGTSVIDAPDAGSETPAISDQSDAPEAIEPLDVSSIKDVTPPKPVSGPDAVTVGGAPEIPEPVAKIGAPTPPPACSEQSAHVAQRDAKATSETKATTSRKTPRRQKPAGTRRGKKVPA